MNTRFDFEHVPSNDAATIEAVKKVTKDINAAALMMPKQEVAVLASSYFKVQQQRKAMGLRSGALEKAKISHSVTDFFENQFFTIEKQIKAAMNRYMNASDDPAIEWMRSIRGVGPVISTGIFSEIDISKANYAGSLWRFAGLDSTIVWKKGEKRPFNAQLKLYCYYLGESFVKQGNFYRKVYRDRKVYETEMNEKCAYADQARDYAAKINYKPGSNPFKLAAEGKFAPFVLHNRARRYAVKLFLSHLHSVWREGLGLTVARPFAIEHLGHGRMIFPPLDDRDVQYYNEDDYKTPDLIPETDEDESEL